MDITMLVLVPGIIGGFVLALLLFRFQAPRSSMDPFSREAPFTDIINIARIRVAGVGGLGLVAMALVVAWFLPRVWQYLAVGAVLGVVLGAVLIVMRRD